MAKVTLNSSTGVERAEAGIHAAGARATTFDIVSHGFAQADLNVILARLPDTWRYLQTSPTTVTVWTTPPAVAATTANPYALTTTTTQGATVTTPAAGALHKLEVWTANLNFGNGLRADKADARTLRKQGAQVVLTQELHEGGRAGTRLSDIFAGEGWANTQAAGNGDASKAGISVRDDLAGGATGTKNLGGKFGRVLVSQVIELDGRKVEVASVHLDPQRSGLATWRRQVVIVGLWARTRPHPVIIGGDWNAPFTGSAGGRSMAYAASVTGLRKSGDGIDGFLFSKSLRAGDAGTVADRKTRSDHGFTGRTFTWK